MRSYRYTAGGPPKALCAYLSSMSAAHASPARQEGEPRGPWSRGPQLSAQSCRWAVGPQVELGPAWLPDGSGFLTGRGDQSSSGPQSVGGATGTGPPVRVRVRRVGGQPNPGPRRDLGARSPSLQFQGAGPGPKPACLVLSPSSGPLSRVEPPEERPQVQMHPQQGGACGAAACCEARPPALAGQGQGVWGSAHHAGLTAVWAPSPGLAALSHT